MNFMDGLPPSKRHFFQTYDRLRERIYSKKVIKASWRIAGIFPRSPETAILGFRKQMNKTSVQTRSSFLDAASIENMADSDDSNPATESTSGITPMGSSWQAHKMNYIRNHSTMLRGLDNLHSMYLASQAKTVVMQHKIEKLENELRQNKGKTSKRTRRKQNVTKKIYQLLKTHLDLPEEDSEDEASKASETPEENAEISGFLLISVVENFYNCFMYSLFLICLFFYLLAF